MRPSTNGVEAAMRLHSAISASFRTCKTRYINPPRLAPAPARAAATFRLRRGAWQGRRHFRRPSGGGMIGIVLRGDVDVTRVCPLRARTGEHPQLLKRILAGEDARDVIARSRIHEQGALAGRHQLRSDLARKAGRFKA